MLDTNEILEKANKLLHKQGHGGVVSRQLVMVLSVLVEELNEELRICCSSQHPQQDDDGSDAWNDEIDGSL